MKTSFLLTTLFLTAQAYSDELPPLEPTYLHETPKYEDIIQPKFEIPTPTKSPFLAVGLSSLLPGLGQAYLGDYRSAGGFIASFGVLTGLSLWENEFQGTSLVTAQNLLSYNIYAAYRDVRAFNRNEGYPYPMPTETLSELALVQFDKSSYGNFCVKAPRLAHCKASCIY